MDLVQRPQTVRNNVINVLETVLQVQVYFAVPADLVLQLEHLLLHFCGQSLPLHRTSVQWTL